MKENAFVLGFYIFNIVKILFLIAKGCFLNQMLWLFVILYGKFI